MQSNLFSVYIQSILYFSAFIFVFCLDSVYFISVSIFVFCLDSVYVQFSPERGATHKQTSEEEFT